ncbi:MAG: hypothetical protein AAGA55_00815 [Planctomycetota bacterium]
MKSDARARSKGSGFVMPMVLLATVVVGMGVGVAMTRFAAQTKVVARQARAYNEHHAGRGLQEAIGAWLRQQNGRNIGDAIDPDSGHAMDIELKDGSVVSVYLRDGQGTALADLGSVPSNRIEEAGLVIKNLSDSVSTREYLRLTRSVGPSAISINSAPEAVVRAVAEAVGGADGEAFADELLRIRARGREITRQDITSSIGAAGLSKEQRTAALRMMSTDISLWAVIVELRGGAGLQRGRLLSRYGGLARLRVGTTRNSTSNPSELGSFLTWRELSTESDEIELEDLDAIN